MKSMPRSLASFLGLLLAVAIAGGQDDANKPQPAPTPPPQDAERRIVISGPAAMFGGGMGERKLVKQFDKDGDKRLNAEERQAAREFLKKDRAQNPRRGFPGGPGGRGFGKSPAQQLTEAADTDKDGKLSKQELTGMVDRFFTACDKEKTGVIDEKRMAETLKQFMPSPFGPPGGGPGRTPARRGERAAPPQPVRILPMLQDRVALTDVQKKQIEELQTDLDAKLNKILTDEQRRTFRDRRGGAEVPGEDVVEFVVAGQGLDGEVPNFVFAGPGADLAKGIMQRADANKDGKLSRPELQAALDSQITEHDKNKDGKLDDKELGAANTALMPAMPTFGAVGGPGGREREPAKPGPKVSPSQVKNFPNAGLYDPSILRTIFIEFENKDWDAELADFYRTDVEVPAKVTVDGKTYPNVGVHFRGMSSYGMAGDGYKKSLNLTFDFADPKQKLYGYKTTNLLNLASDPSSLSTVLYSHIARKYIPAPKANLVKVVINGESWGVYANTQQFNKDFIAENFKDAKGARWKVPGPGGESGLYYLGDKVEEYRRRYEIKSGDNKESWDTLIKLCRVLKETPSEQLEDALKPMLDIDGVLWFLALDIALINNDGYWTRASDYSLFLDDTGKFHMIPHDMNEGFQAAMSFGFGPPGGGRTRPGRPGENPGVRPTPPPVMPRADGPPQPPTDRPQPPRGSGFELDPLHGADDAFKPLRSRLLAVPSLREKYLRNVRTIANDWLDWEKLGPIVAQYRELAEKEIEGDTRKLASTATFRKAVSDSPEAEPEAPGRRPAPSLRRFADQRRKYLLNHPEIQKLNP